MDVSCSADIVIRVATGYGQPPSTVYDWTLNPSGLNEPSFRLSPDVERRLLIEIFCNKVTKALYSNRLDPVGLIDDTQRPVLTTFLARDFEDIEEKLGTQISCMFATSYFRTWSILWSSSCLDFHNTAFRLRLKCFSTNLRHNMLT